MKKILITFFILIYIGGCLLAAENPEAISNTENTYYDNLPELIEKQEVGKFFEKYQSMMFLQTSIDEIIKVLNKTYISAELSPEISSLTSRSLEIVSENNLNVYLNSIMYLSPTHWTVWLNGQKITNLNNGESEIKVIALNPKKAVFEWNIGLSKWAIVNVNQNISTDVYTINEDRVLMQFTLSPNQTFIPAFNQVIEGKVKIEAPEEEVVTTTNNEPVVVEGENNFYF